MRLFNKVRKELGLPEMRFHDQRHTAASLLLAQNVHPKVVEEMLGHSSFTLTLDTYSHIIFLLCPRSSMDRVPDFEAVGC